MANQEQYLVKCPRCGEIENLHANYDWSKENLPVLEWLCNECGKFFQENEKPKEDVKRDPENL